MATIIVVDDEPDLRRLVRYVLEDAGHTVIEFVDGRGAIEHLKRESADLLITDIFMPNFEGLETIRMVRTLRPELPILAISGLLNERSDYLGVAARFGADATLRKPFEPSELIEAAALLLAQHCP
ncbi:MAG: response regulator [Thiohalocapsa sp.]